MSDWLGVEDDYDAKKSGRGIGSWDNFEDDNDGWKGGATSSDGASSEDMLSAVASMGDDELLGHDIWFVATGASDCDGAGMKAFLASHRDKLRGVFFINLESVGAGRLSVVTVEGEQQLLKGDRRIMNLVSKVCKHASGLRSYRGRPAPQCQPDEHCYGIRGRDRGYPPFVDGALRSQRVFVY